MLYDCYADGDGGGIYIDEDAKKVDIRNFTIRKCTADSFKADGGGIYICKNDFTMIDSSIEGCYSNDNGGGACIDSDGSGSGNLSFKNVIFSNNIAEDYAGALCIWDYDDEGDYLMLDGCDFFSNSSNTSDGGAVYIDGTSDVFTLFKNCNFMYNESGNDGGAMTVNEHNVALASCLFAQNETEAAGGAIYVNGSYSINVKGLMIIKDNKSLITSTTKTRYGTHNLCLNGRAMLYSGGLYEGSYIGISKFSQGSNDEVAEGIAEYQQKYFHSDQKNIKFEKTGTVDTPIITNQSNETASVFGTGSVVVIVSVAVAALAAGLAALAVKKKKGVAENGNDENE